MTTALDTIRYHSGMAGEEVADLVDELEAKVARYEQAEELRRTNGTIVEAELREQVEKLTKELFDYKREFKDDREELREAEQRIAALTKERDEARRTVQMAHEEGTKQLDAAREYVEKLKGE